MDSYDIGRMTYLILLGVAVGGWFVAQNRNSLGKIAQYGVVWTLLFVGVIAAYGLWSDIRNDIAPRQTTIAAGTISVPRSVDGHYYLTLSLNGTPVRFAVDTGATNIVLTRDDARRIGVDLNGLIFSGTATTANGVVRTARIKVSEIRFEDIFDNNVPVYVNEGELDGSLLGMSYLQKFEKVEISGDTLILTR